MLVYGDPQFTTTISEFRERLRHQIPACGEHDLDSLRSLLIQTGQLEQGICDYRPQSSLTKWTVSLTDLVAEIFLGACGKQVAGLPTSPQVTYKKLELVRELLEDGINGSDDEPLTIKVPEGFEFYALYPEQYALAAMAWLKSQAAREGPVLIVGLRSIGTTLSAVVRATLSVSGCRNIRCTVRPEGHPFQRVVRLPSDVPSHLPHALIVDEGPGLSGSSVAATAQALLAKGFPGHSIALLPGHGNGPGNATSEETRTWWKNCPHFVVGREHVRWNGCTLTDSLAEKARVFLASESSPSVEDLSGGGWRKWVVPDRESNNRTRPEPWSCPPLESIKYRCSIRSGQAILWKFLGLGAAGPNGETRAKVSLARLLRRAEAGWTPKPLGLFRGFVTLPWLSGAACSAGIGTARQIQEHVAKYIAAAAQPPLSSSEHHAAMARLEQMIHSNLQPVFGSESAALAARAVRALEIPALRPSYGDGRLAPHEWLRLENGHLIKFDAAGHDLDHSFVGPQPVDWDIAGFLVEWGLVQRAGGFQEFFSALSHLGLDPGAPSERAVFQIAYSAFRLGQVRLARDAAGRDAASLKHLRDQERACCDHIARGLEQIVI